MRVLLTSVAAAVMLVAIGAVGSKVEAAMLQGVKTLPLQTSSHSGIEKVGYYRRHARRYYRRAYRRGYYGYGYPGYGYYRPYYGYGYYRPYYGYGYRPYGYYGYGWRPGISITFGRGWGWGY
jgi:hypothetical protein